MSSPPFEIRRLGPADAALVHAAAELFDGAPLPEATERFLRSPTHHLLMATDLAGRQLGFVSGVEVTHPDKGTEMFLYELSVAVEWRRRGIGRSLVEALEGVARERGCYGMFVATEADNTAARRT
ncbi:MAG TPA: GNAT family N-acetyltransferase, partial [Thermoleophilaceae bacterium]|nr:GNAT family N-acetyltransferase [Thermoleophilaceae bacterium]